MSRIEKKMSLEFSETMFNEIKKFVGRRHIFTCGMDVVDSGRVLPSVPRQFGRSLAYPHPTPMVELGSPLMLTPTLNANAWSSTIGSKKPSDTTSGDYTSRSTGHKRRMVGIDNLVDFIKDFNHDYISRVKVQDRDKRLWRSKVLAFDHACEEWLAQKRSWLLT